MAGRVLRKNGPPLHLVFFITNRCDFRCRHCFLVANGQLNDKSRALLNLDEIEDVARSLPRLTALSLTGGEPFLRTDYAAIVDRFARHTDVRSISTVTNGVSSERIVPQLEQVLAENDLNFFLTFSLDGDAPTHDSVRQKPGSFGRTLSTIREVLALTRRFPRLAVGVNSTYIGTNSDALMALYDKLEEFPLDFVTLNMMRGVDWTDRIDGLRTEEYRRLSERKNRLIRDASRKGALLRRTMRATDRILTDLVADTHDSQASLFPCYGGRLLGVLKENGDVLACEQISERLGNVRETGYDFAAAWNTTTARARRRSIERGECHCTYECVMTSNILFNPRFHPRLALELIRS